MKKIVLLIISVMLLTTTVSAMEFTAPAPPEQAEEFLPDKSGTFSEDLWYIIKKAITAFYPSISQAAAACVSVLAIVMLASLLRDFTGTSHRIINLICTIAVSTALLSPSNALIKIGVETVNAVSEYGKLLFPVLTAALAAEGGTTTSTALYAGTMVFNTILTTAITSLLIPMLYAFLALGVAKAAITEPLLENLQAFLKWLITWTLKIAIYLFTGYIGITGVIGGSADAAAVKAAKLAISGVVPVVGSIISDASETILVSAGVMKNSVGIYGSLAIIAAWIGPFVQIGTQYLTLKLTAAVSSVFGCKEAVSAVHTFSGAMGFLVAITGTVSILLLISVVCYMKGVG